jgi:hypothetical protein
MKFLSWGRDGGPESAVDALFVVEIKSLFSIVLLRFNAGGRETFHTHAFNALTWFICGDAVEQDINGEYYVYSRKLIPKITRRSKNHRVCASTTSWALSIRGPWAATWTEDDEQHHTVLTHKRTVVRKERKTN